MEEDQLLNPKQVAQILGVHQKTVHLWLRSGKLQGSKISYRTWRISRTALNSFIEGNSIERLKKSGDVTEGKDRESLRFNILENRSGENITGMKKENDSPQTKMKYYIRDVMGEESEEN